MNELALFAGAGGGILGGHLLGWRTVCAVEWEQYPASVLCARQNDGFLPSFPIWDDVQTFDGKPWQGIVDVVSGGFPCQDISAAGKGDGLDGERSGMWKEMARIIGEVRPKYAYIENSPMLTTRGLERVLADLAQMGFDAEWGVLGASAVGGNHKRERIWIMAYSSYLGLCGQKAVKRLERNKRLAISSLDTQWWKREPKETSIEVERTLGGMDDGLASRVDRLKAIGNGQVPRVASIAWKLLIERLENGRY
jgi:DNA (cytosine-5)-methyltransferase 1